MKEAQSQPINADCFSIFIPLTIKKRGGNVATMILPKNHSLKINNANNYDYPLINALVKAYRLQKQIDKNPKMTAISLAEQEGLTKGYVGRLLRLNLLSPDIIGAILEGRQPKDLKLQDLLRKEIPMIWEEQVENFGFLLK